MLQGVRGFSGAETTPYLSQAVNSVKRRLPLHTIALAILVLSSDGRADTLWLQNGDTISGEILGLDAGTLKLKTEYAGTVEIDWRHVRAVDSEQQLWVSLVGEKQPRLRSLNQLSTGVEVEDIDEGKKRQFSTVWAVSAIYKEKPVLEYGWQFGGDVALSLDSKMGNSNREKYTLDGSLSFDDEWNKNTLLWDFETTAYTTYNSYEWSLKYAYNRFISEHVYLVGVAEWGYDSGADDRVRSILGPGIGYRFWETAQQKLQTSIGIVRLWERYSTNLDQDDYAFVWTINFKTKFYRNISYYNNLKLDYRLQRESRLDVSHGLTMPLNENASVRFSHTFDYDSQALTEVEKFDSQIKIRLGYQW